MNKTIAFTIADDNNLPFAKMMVNSFHKFHPDIEVTVISGEALLNSLKADPHFFYRATPVIAEKLFKEGYETVIKIDADSLILGDLTHVIESTGYDIGTVLNFNRTDFKTYGPIQVAGIYNTEYYNCGFVVMKNKRFVERWKELCFGSHFERYQYREQDLLNFMCFYGDWKVKCFDDFDPETNYSAWHGLLNKNEGLNMKLDGDKIILPKSEEGYPIRDVEVKAYHFAGEGPAKMKYRLCFPEDIIKRIDYLVGDKK